AMTGGPSELLPAPWGWDGSLSPDGKKIVIDRVSRWDVEFRHYRGGQNTPLEVLDLQTLSEQQLPNTDRTMDIDPDRHRSCQPLGCRIPALSRGTEHAAGSAGSPDTERAAAAEHRSNDGHPPGMAG